MQPEGIATKASGLGNRNSVGFALLLLELEARGHFIEDLGDPLMFGAFIQGSIELSLVDSARSNESLNGFICKTWT